jgi:hypothetical protein
LPEGEGFKPSLKGILTVRFEIGGLAGLGRILIYLGIVIVIAGVLVSFSDRWPWLGHLPGDIHIQRERFSFHFPLTTSIVVSIVISFVAYLFKR